MYGLYTMIFCLHHVQKHFLYQVLTNILLSICGIDKFSISGIEKSVFVYIIYGQIFVISYKQSTYSKYYIDKLPYTIQTKLCLSLTDRDNLYIPLIDNLYLCRIEIFFPYNIKTICLYNVQKNCLYQVQTKIIFSIPNIYINVLSMPHEDKLSIPHIGKTFLSICYMDNVSKFCIHKTFMSICRIEKLSILFFDNIYIYYVDKTKLSASQG